MTEQAWSWAGMRSVPGPAQPRALSNDSCQGHWDNEGREACTQHNLSKVPQGCRTQPWGAWPQAGGNRSLRLGQGHSCRKPREPGG